MGVARVPEEGAGSLCVRSKAVASEMAVGACWAGPLLRRLTEGEAPPDSDSPLLITFPLPLTLRLAARRARAGTTESAQYSYSWAAVLANRPNLAPSRSATAEKAARRVRWSRTVVRRDRRNKVEVVV